MTSGIAGGGALRVEGLGKSFGASRILGGIDLSVPAGSLLAVLGRSGSGKTTLLRAIAGFERIDRGSISIGGVAVAGPGLHVAVERRGVGYVAQEGALFPHLSVARNVLFGLPRSERRDLALAGRLLRMVGLPASMASRAPSQLSGGEQQRVALARALSMRPALVLLDEPFSALDAGLRQETRLAVADALAEAGATALLVTHDQAEALSMGDLVAVLRDGGLAQIGRPQAIYRNPADPALALFVGQAVLTAAVVRNRTAIDTTFGACTVSVPIRDGPATVMIRPEQFVLDPAGRIEAALRRTVFCGPDAVLHLDLADGSSVVARVPGHAVPQAGATLRLSISGDVMAWPG